MFVSVLGIDPGLTRCGYGIVKYDEKRIVELEKAGILSTSPQEAISSRLAEIHHDLTQIINESKPDFIAVERVLFKANVSTAMSVSQVNGLVHSLAASYSIPITEFSPTEVKNAITGHGRADKKAVQEMVMKLLRLTKNSSTSRCCRCNCYCFNLCISINDEKWFHRFRQRNL